MTPGVPVKTVVVADDEPFLRELIHATVESEACRVIDAADGDEAWLLIKEHRPSLALLDVRMPGRNGLELARAIRADSELAATHIILIAATAHVADQAAGLAAGADSYVTKPFSPTDLRALVEAALGG
jgi:DNA-binding response OmpR family regulator